jgi:hypothetical protein
LPIAGDVEANFLRRVTDESLVVSSPSSLINFDYFWTARDCPMRKVIAIILIFIFIILFINDDGELTTNDSSVTLLRKLASTSPAIGNV